MLALQMFFNTLAINTANIGDALKCMLWGMIGIFTVTAIIIVSVIILNVVTRDRKKGGSDDNS